MAPVFTFKLMRRNLCRKERDNIRVPAAREMRIRVAKPNGSKVEMSVREDDKVETLRALVVMMLEVSAPVPPIAAASLPWYQLSKSTLALPVRGLTFHTLNPPTHPEPGRMVEQTAHTRRDPLSRKTRVHSRGFSGESTCCCSARGEPKEVIEFDVWPFVRRLS